MRPSTSGTAGEKGRESDLIASHVTRRHGDGSTKNLLLICVKETISSLEGGQGQKKINCHGEGPEGGSRSAGADLFSGERKKAGEEKKRQVTGLLVHPWGDGAGAEKCKRPRRASAFRLGKVDKRDKKKGGKKKTCLHVSGKVPKKIQAGKKHWPGEGAFIISAEGY